MTQEYFDAPLFIKEVEKAGVDLWDTPFLCNIGGRPVYAQTLPTGVVPLEPASSDPGVGVGREYKVRAMPPQRPDPDHGEQTQLEFAAGEVVYEPMWATRAAAAAFGMTLVEKGQGIRVSSPVRRLAHIDYEYGMFAGHRSPYLGTGYRLLGVVGTDLECHDFPHVFASVDAQLPLVISVGRYWPKLGRIYLADLWLPRGDALYVPPRAGPAEQPCLYLHGNRNAALACWRGIGQSSVRTETLLQDDGGFFHWFWSASPSIHPLLK